MDNRKFYDYVNDFGEEASISPRIAMHMNGDLFFGFQTYEASFNSHDGEKEWWSYGDVTINSGPNGMLPYLHSALAVEDGALEFVPFLEQNGFGVKTDKKVRVDGVSCPLFKWNEDKIREINPELLEAYQKQHGVVKLPLDN